MVRKIEAENLPSDRLEIVRRGYDPFQVQRLVSTLATELKALVAENDALRARLKDAPVRARDATGGFVERRAPGTSAAALTENADLRENLRWARSALDQLLNQLTGHGATAGQQREESQR